jgi:hypothetical protein
MTGTKLAAIMIALAGCASPAQKVDWHLAFHPSGKENALPSLTNVPNVEKTDQGLGHPDPVYFASMQFQADGAKPLNDPALENLRLEAARPYGMSLCQDKQRCVWVGTELGGVQRFDPSTPTLHQWTQFTTNDGLGDNNGYAIACDRLGRIWVGHLNHGVSVYNGRTWQNYEVVGIRGSKMDSRCLARLKNLSDGIWFPVTSAAKDMRQFAITLRRILRHQAKLKSICRPTKPPYPRRRCIKTALPFTSAATPEIGSARPC